MKKIKEKAREILEAEEGYVTVKKLSESVERLDKEIEKEGLKAEKGRGLHKPEKIRKRDEQKALLDRWEGYERKKKILGEKRNSYSKTDPDTTFMHMKDDHTRGCCRFFASATAPVFLWYFFHCPCFQIWFFRGHGQKPAQVLTPENWL